MIFSKKLGKTVLLVSLLLSGTSFASSLPLDGAKLLKASLDYSGALSQSSFSGEILNTFETNGTKVTKTHVVDVLLSRPNKLKVFVHGEGQNREYILNSGHFSVIDAPLFVYGESDVPTEIDAALDHIFKEFNMNPPMGALVYSDKHPRPKTEKFSYLGEDLIGETPCHKVKVFLAKKTIVVWISKDELKPLVLRYDITQKEVPAHVAKEISTRITWKNGVSIKDDDFKFSAPDNCHKIPFLGDKK